MEPEAEEEEEEEERSPTPDPVQEDHPRESPHSTSTVSIPSLTTDPLRPILAEIATPTPPPHPKPEESWLLNSAQRSISPSINRSESQPASSFRGRSTTGTSFVSTTTITTTTATPSRARNERYPTPPPPDDPLGPSAKPPYLPAHSDYGGPSVLYSCRPGGPCLFDLLGTLPMKEFGILDWQVLDCEEEIYESDDVKEEYKIMHALWGRWIVLHR